MWYSLRRPHVQGLTPWLAGPFSKSPCLVVAVVSMGVAEPGWSFPAGSSAKEGPHRCSGIASLGWGVVDGNWGTDALANNYRVETD